MNWNEWMTWNERIEMNEWLEMNELRWIEMNEFKWMNWKERIAKSAPNAHFFTTFIWNWALATISCTFCRPKVLRTCHQTCQFLRFLFCEFELSLHSRAHCFDHFLRSSRAPAETETLQRRPRTATFSEETQGLAPESVLKREFTRFRSLTLRNYLTATWWWCCWHDAVVPDSHHDKTALRKPFLIRKFPS